VFLNALQKPIFDIIGGFQPPLGIVLMVGPLGGFLALIINIAALIISIYSMEMKKEPLLKYHMLSLLLLMGTNGMVLTGDIFNLFVFLEVTSIASYGLASYNKDIKGFEGALKYVILGSIGSTFVLIGIALIYSQLRTLNMLDIATRLGEMDPIPRLWPSPLSFLDSVWRQRCSLSTHGFQRHMMEHHIL